jgi:hypothetical protein
VARLVSTAFVLALLAATLWAFVLTQAAKTERSPIFRTSVDRVFSPACACDKRAADIDFELRDRERLEVWMEHDGRRVATLVPGRTFEAGPVPLAFNGVTDDGLTLPDGDYVPVVRLTRSHRTIRLPNPITIDTRAPRIAVPKTPKAIVSPDGDGRRDSFSARFSLPDAAHAVMLVNDRRVVVTRRLVRSGAFRWNGRLNGRAVPRGIYVLDASAQDVAGNRAKPYPFAVVQVRYVALGRKRIVARPGGRIALRVSTDSPTVQWRLAGRAGVARRGTLLLRAPRRSGVFHLYVSANGHAAKAAVVVA